MGRSAFTAFFGHSRSVSAVMAQKISVSFSLDIFFLLVLGGMLADTRRRMIRQRHVAVRTHNDLTAHTAVKKITESASVQKQNGLISRLLIFYKLTF